MDWVLVVLVLTTAPNFTQSHSHALVNFTSERLCAEAALNLKKDLGQPASNVVTVDVRASCLHRKDAK